MPGAALLVSVNVARSATRYGHTHLCVPRARLSSDFAACCPLT